MNIYCRRLAFGLDLDDVGTDVTHEAGYVVSRCDAANRLPKEYPLDGSANFYISSLAHAAYVRVASPISDSIGATRIFLPGPIVFETDTLK
ncbi:MAG TPA: hypothetical protein VEW74_08015 [Candidatus Nitrosotalea sp.]|nr:hypothetical protein [Candidatus Nitrosotalea sp.]